MGKLWEEIDGADGKYEAVLTPVLSDTSPGHCAPVVNSTRCGAQEGIIGERKRKDFESRRE
jgi:hypothetical protein